MRRDEWEEMPSGEAGLTELLTILEVDEAE